MSKVEIMTGKRKTFRRYLLEEIKRMTGSSTYRLKDMARNANWYTLPYLYVYAFYFASTDRLASILQLSGKKIPLFPLLPADPEKMDSIQSVEYREYVSIWKRYKQYLENVSSQNSQKKTYHKQIKQLFKEAKMTQSALAKATGISQGNISSFLSGDLSSVNIEKCKKMVDALKASSSTKLIHSKQEYFMNKKKNPDARETLRETRNRVARKRKPSRS